MCPKSSKLFFREAGQTLVADLKSDMNGPVPNAPYQHTLIRLRDNLNT
jgi:hypothetical protein